MKKILFVCSQNKLRSPTAEAVFTDYEDWEVRSAGLNNDAEIPLGKEDVQWADYIFVMEKIHKSKIQQQFKSVLKNQKLICLDIPDIYSYMDEKLVLLLKKSVPKYVK
ncbi:MAG: low molecular weight protein tyrosine phosphatase family protein [Candidatus Berkiella sp.]